MCGILATRGSIPLSTHLRAFQRIKSRGPDFDRYEFDGHTFIGQTVLHITGDRTYYDQAHDGFLSYNGEIYNYQELGDYHNDIELVHDAVNRDLSLLTKGWGPWAWAWKNGDSLTYATDPQGEKTLYQYRDDDILIISSEISAILEYVDLPKVPVPYLNKTWTMLGQSPWQGISKIQPGWLYRDGQPQQEIDSIWSWIGDPVRGDAQEIYDQFVDTWQYVNLMMMADTPCALAYSGGLDSSIILDTIPGLELYAINNLGKDPIVDRLTEFLTPTEQHRLTLMPVNEELWAIELQNMVDRLRMPVQSWSWIGHWILNRVCDQRVLFTGLGADELFGGYEAYKGLTFTQDRSASPYSHHGEPQLWNKCLEAYNGHAEPATLLMDYWCQVVGCDICGVDLIAGSWGHEARNPFLAKPIMQFALNLPMQYRRGKPLIQRRFTERWPESLILPKKGFTGHANDSLPWLGIQAQGSDRMEQWRDIAWKTFYAADQN
jgi:asparagine synthetase B (glutamine-hydrolysing)